MWGLLMDKLSPIRTGGKVLHCRQNFSAIWYLLDMSYEEIRAQIYLVAIEPKMTQ